MVYLIKSIACLLILLLVHRLLLQREAMHRFNRFFLLFSVVVSFVIPLYTIEVPENLVTAQVKVVSEPTYFEAASQDFNQEQVFAPIPESQFNWEYLLLGLYGLISLSFLYRFIRNIKILVNKIQRNIKINYRGQTLVLLKEDSLPFSFLKYIFVSESDLENEKFTDAVFAHECTHIQERHSWDNLFIEALLVPFWFHPGLHWAKQVIKLNHEFIADEVALRSTPLEKYESQLLAMMLSEQKYGLVSSLNFSLTKKRFEMMTRKTKPTNKWLKLSFLIPVLGAVIYLFSEKVDGKSVDLTEKADLSLSNSDLSTTIDAYSIVHEGQINSSIAGQTQDKERHYRNASIFVENNSGELEPKSYNELGEELLRMLPPPTKPPLPKSPTKEEFESWKNSENFAIWIDELHVPNSKLAEFENTDIARFFDSFVYPNARTERFPQEHQVHMYTKAGFEKVYGPGSGFGEPLTEKDKLYLYPADRRVQYGSPWVKKDKDFKKPASNTVGATVNYQQTSSPIAQLLSPSDAYADYAKLKLEYEAGLDSGVHFLQKSQAEQEALQALFADLSGRYFRLEAKEKRQAGRPKHPFAPYSRFEFDGKTVYKMYADLTESERKQLPPPPPLDATSTELTTYNSELNTYELNRNKGQHYVDKSTAAQKLAMDYYQKTQRMNALLPLAEKQLTKALTHPFAPYVRIEKELNSYFKLAKDLTEEERKNMAC